MICIYSTDNTNYSNNGDAVLIPISCTLTMTINGAWQLDLEHPYDAEERYKLIQEGAVIRADIKCVGEQSTIRQRFRIYTYNRGVNSVTCIAFPIAMEATFDAPIDNLVLENKTASEAVTQLQTLTQKYSIETNVTGTKSTSLSNTNINSALASGDDGCFIQVWGGEVVYDNLKFNIRSRIGSDTGYKIQYGHNMTGIDYSKDDSGLSTRVHPISEDGIRLNGTGYVDSPLIDEYPIHHDRYMITPYRLVDTEEASPSRTAQETRACVSAVTTATTTLSQSSYTTALGAGYQPDYIKTINADIITAVQNMALANVISTDLYKLLSDTIKNAMAWLAELTQPEWGWMGSDQTGWRYGDTNGYAKDMYVRIGKTWSYFGSQGYWEEPKDDKEEWDWHQKEGEGRRYGNFNKYFAHNTFVYITMEGTLQEYWFNEEGWYEADESGKSEWSWHGSGTSEDPYWFGEEGATSEDPKKYAHDTWLFIDGAYYFFDRYGYYAPNTAILDYQWDWVQDDERWWFGNAINREFAAVYVESQWLKINGTWYYFDEDGYVVDQDSSRSDAIAVFTTGMASLLTTVNTRKDALYTLLYALMTEWVNKKYAEGIDKPALTVTVSMADLSRTTEYANFAALETIKLGDSVEIDDTEHGIHTTGSRVIGLTYDVIRGYNSNVVIGKPQATVSSMLSQANGQAVAGGFDTSAIEAQIDALQDRVSDVRYNGRSLLQGTIAILDSIGGTSINYGTSTPTGGSDGDVYFQHANSMPFRVEEGAFNGDLKLHSAKEQVYYFDIYGTPTAGGADDMYLYFKGLVTGRNYKVIIDFKFADDTYWIGWYNDWIYLEDANGTDIETVKLKDDYEIHRYELSFVGEANNRRLAFYFNNVKDGEFSRATMTIQIVGALNIDWNEPQEIIDIWQKVGSAWYSFLQEPYLAGERITIDTEKREINADAQIICGKTAPTNDIGKDGYMYIKYAEDLPDYTEVWRGTVSSSAWASPVRIGNVVPSDYLYLKVDGVEKAVAEIPVVGSSGKWNIHGQAYVYKSEDESVLWLYSSTGYTSTVTSVDGISKQQIPTDVEAVYEKISGYWVEVTTGGGGGTEVIPNPQGTATDTLNTVSIDGTIYDIEGGGGSNLIIDAQKYSLEEEVVGIWTDGKPLYQKTYQFNGSLGRTFTILDNTLDKDIVICSDSYYMISGSSIVFASNNMNNYNLVVGYNPTAGLYIENYSSYTITKALVTIRYTKTADTAGSGGYQAYGFSPIIYSDDEREVGVWMDGKPLYQKTVKVTSIARNVWNSYLVDADAVIKNIDGWYGDANNRLPLNYFTGSVMMNRTSDHADGYFSLYGSGTLATAIVTVQYTKTTDVAGSGEYNTLAIPNVHYSTDEQVIGTWVDGKTLYQKTVTTGGGVPTGATLIEREVMEGYDTIKYTKA